jgi:hypothetical protein
VLLSVVFLGFSIWAAVVAAAADLREAPGWLGIALLHAGVAIAMFRFGVWPALMVTEHGLLVRNPLRSYRVPWNDVERMEPGYQGIRIVRKNASPVIAMAVQKSNWATARRRWTRADRVIASLVEARARSTGVPDRSIEPTAERRDALSTVARRAIVAGFASLIIWTIARIMLA